MRLFTEFMAVHDDLERALAAHQEALVGLDLARAAAHLATYDRLLRAHIAEEERYVLPTYAAKVPGAADIELYRGEHRRFEAFLEELRERTAALGALADPRAAVVAVLDREAVLKNVLLHHDLRERNALYPALDRATSAAEREAVFAAIERGGPPPFAAPEAAPDAGRRIADVRVGAFLVAVKLASGAVGLAETPLLERDSGRPDPDALVGRDARALGEGSPLERAIAAAAREALAGTRRAPAPERLLTLVSRGATLADLARIGRS
jgi:hypothetical protein